MPATNNIKLTIGGPETDGGTAVAMEYVIPVMGVPSIDKKVEKTIDPAILGTLMDAGEYLIADSVEGEIPIAFRPTAGVGMLTKSLMGTEETPVQVGACLRLMYTGSDASCKIVPDASGETITSTTGVKGSEAVDSNFGTTGVVDLAAADFDTLAELVAKIEGYTGYSCEQLFGADSFDTSASILAFTSPGNTRQGKNTWVYIYFLSATSGVYKHEFTPDLGITEKDTYSIQFDGRQDNMLYDGVVVNTMSLSAALKGMVESSVNVLGMGETIGQSASALTLETVEPLIFSSGSFYLGANNYNYIRNHSLELNNNNNADGYGMGSTSRLYHQKGKFDVTGDMQVRLDATSYAERAKISAGTQIATSFTYTGGTLTTDIDEMVIVEMPYCVISNYEFTENNGVFDAKINFKALNPAGTLYNDPVTITFLTTDSGVY